MRDRLVEMIQNSVGGCAKHWAEIIADNLLANGVVVPPVSVGQTVYIIDEGDGECAEDYVLGVEVTQIFINKHGIGIDLQLPLGLRLNAWAVIGKNVFLAKEEAEQALATMEGGE